MNVGELASALGLQVLAGQALLQRQVSGGYASDLLSCVMAKARAGNIWVTLQAHANVVAVASLLDLAAVIIAEGIQPDTATCEKAEAEGVVLLSASQTTYAVVGAATQLGIAPGS
ncbi:MAG TPA: DRTGG domain-containing protein [Anaerolineae bacterium]|nr:DRTGG domain-containing protein [Anaerolineae bacterium]